MSQGLSAPIPLQGKSENPLCFGIKPFPGWLCMCNTARKLGRSVFRSFSSPRVGKWEKYVVLPCRSSGISLATTQGRLPIPTVWKSSAFPPKENFSDYLIENVFPTRRSRGIWVAAKRCSIPLSRIKRQKAKNLNYYIRPTKAITSILAANQVFPSTTTAAPSWEDSNQLRRLFHARFGSWWLVLILIPERESVEPKLHA